MILIVIGDQNKKGKKKHKKKDASIYIVSIYLCACMCARAKVKKGVREKGMYMNTMIFKNHFEEGKKKGRKKESKNLLSACHRMRDDFYDYY